MITELLTASESSVNNTQFSDQFDRKSQKFPKIAEVFPSFWEKIVYLHQNKQKDEISH